MRIVFAAFLLLAFASTTAQAGPPLASQPCKRTDALFSHLPTDLAFVSGIVPLGAMNPASHTLPTRHIYVYPKMTTPGDVSTALTLKVASPGAAELVAVESRGGGLDWSLHIKPCKDVSLYYYHITKLSPALALAIGDMAAGSVVLPGGTVAKPVSIALAPGQFLGTAKAFDIGLHDFRKAPQPFANRRRYRVDFPVLFAGYPAFAGDPIAALVVPLIVPQSLYNRCPIYYFTPALRAAMTVRLSDYSGAPLATGTTPVLPRLGAGGRCHSHMQDVRGTAQGNWWPDLDPVHDAFVEDHALALANSNVTPTVQLFSLNENVPGLSSALLEPAPGTADVNTTFEFPVREGPERTNRRFAEITDEALYCYDLVRMHRGGRGLNAAILLQVGDGPGGRRTKLKIEFVPSIRCPALKLPWTFSGKEATYHR